ncbi:MAG TPA: tetratricopeptide repeat protein [Thermoanaerobaculia bacterium]|nr:tetratricopeptide repeat protein [Thermoanaerobaculia bacterium]
MLAAIIIAALALPSGYVPDAECTSCHSGIARSYQNVGMSRSFYRPRPETNIEDFDAPPFHHEKSKQWMELKWRDGKLVFRRWTDPSTVFEQPVDWILGSGNHARTYLYATPSGELFQLPIAWYTQTKSWGMAPGYDRADHEGVLRRVRHECMFCHNAYAGVAENTSDGYWRDQSFPAHLPEGIGCQRCHGPGAEHVRRANESAAVARATIVRPTRLDAKKRNDVCYECHMQASVAIAGVRRFGRDITSFRPGQPLGDYLLHTDISENDLPRTDRFEINHHPYRLEQSRCFRESKGRLSCLSCHDPHRKLVVADVRVVCRNCHLRRRDAAGPAAETAALHVSADTDCVSCHMPKRRTQDVVRVVMTDHRIQIKPSGDLVAPREERETHVSDVTFLDRDVKDAEIYRVIAILRAHGGRHAASLQRLETLLATTKPKEIEPYLDLASGQLIQKRYADLEKTARSILERAPQHPLALEWLGVARIAHGHRDEGLALLRGLTRPEARFNLALLLREPSEAIAQLELVVKERPNLAAAWFYLGENSAALGDRERAMECYRRALSIDPNFVRAANALASLQAR